MTTYSLDNITPLSSLQLFGFDLHFKNFVSLFDNNTFPKVNMFTGAKGQGKFTLSLHIVNYILSKKLNQNSDYDLTNHTINPNSPIYKSILNNINQNFIYLGKNYKKKISVDDIRELKKKINISSLNNLPRFIILDDVETFNINSANALLKIIEEPSDTNFFILINNKSQNIIETLKSRSIETKILLSVNEKEEIVKKLMNNFNISDCDYNQYLRYTTPGLFIKFCYLIPSLKISIDDSFFNIGKILLHDYKKNKNEVSLDLLNFLFDVKFFNNIKNNKKSIITASKTRSDIIKLLNNYRFSNLSNESVLYFLKENFNYVK